MLPAGHSTVGACHSVLAQVPLPCPAPACIPAGWSLEGPLPGLPRSQHPSADSSLHPGSLQEPRRRPGTCGVAWWPAFVGEFLSWASLAWASGVAVERCRVVTPPLCGEKAGGLVLGAQTGPRTLSSAETSERMRGPSGVDDTWPGLRATGLLRALSAQLAGEGERAGDSDPFPAPGLHRLTWQRCMCPDQGRGQEWG